MVFTAVGNYSSSRLDALLSRLTNDPLCAGAAHICMLCARAQPIDSSYCLLAFFLRGGSHSRLFYIYLSLHIIHIYILQIISLYVKVYFSLIPYPFSPMANVQTLILALRGLLHILIYI